MAFILPDLILESIIRDGMEVARRDLTVIDDVFGQLTRSFASEKYGNSEVDKIKTWITKKQISVVHSFNLVPTNLPCVSIQLSDDRELENQAHMGDFAYLSQVPMTDPDELADLVFINAFTPSSYNPITGIVKVADSVDLSQIYANLLFVDSTGKEFPITGGINNQLGSRQFQVAAQSSVTIGAGCEIKSSLNYRQYQTKANIEQVQLIVGIHTQDALLTKYLYILVKYFILSRKRDLINRDFQLSTYTGSDFSRNMEYQADVVYTRFLHVLGKVEHSWRSDKVALVDNVIVHVKVPKDKLGNEALDLTESTIQVTGED